MSMCWGQSNINTDNTYIVTANFNVEGMLIKGGFLWMGWPNNIGKALDGLKGIEKQSFDTSSKLFTVLFDSTNVLVSDIKKAVENAGNFTLINWKIIPAESANKIETEEW